MTEHSRSTGPGGVGTTPEILASRETPVGSGVRSPRGFLAAVVFLLALPVAVCVQLLLGSGASLTMHVMLTVGCCLLALAAFDFGAARWAAWTGRVAAGAFAAIFVLQAASELLRNDAFGYFALEVLGNWPERVLITALVVFFVAVVLGASRGRTKILGLVVMTAVACLEAYNYVRLFVAGEPPALAWLYLLPFVWLLFESRKGAEGRAAPRSAPAPE